MKFIITVLFVFFSGYILAQENSIQIDFPKNWIAFNSDNTIRTVKEKVKASDSIKQQILNNNKSSVFLYGYTNPTQKGGYRPNIQVLLRKNPASDDTARLREMVVYSMKDFKTKFVDFSIITQPHVIKVGGKYSIEAKFYASQARQDGTIPSFYSRMLIIPDGPFFYQISLNDTPDYNCTEEFESVIASIKFTAN